MKIEFLRQRRLAVSFGSSTLLAGAALSLTLPFYNPEDPTAALALVPPLAGQVRVVGSGIVGGADISFWLFGPSSLVLAPILIFTGARRIMDRTPIGLLRGLGLAIILSVSAQLHFPTLLWKGAPVTTGGNVASAIIASLGPFPGPVVLSVIVIAMLLYISRRLGIRIRRDPRRKSGFSFVRASAPHYLTFSARRRLSRRLAASYLKREKLLARGRDTTTTDRTIVLLRRELRDGMSVRAGDLLDEGRFKLLKILGSGGFAIVWQAYDRRTHSLVAIKMLHQSLAGDKLSRARFFRGARTMSRIQHAAVAKVIEPEMEDQGYFFYVLEYCPGRDLRHAVLAGQISTAHTVDLICQAAAVLDFAHRQGLVHRDIKPANLLLDSDSRVKLTDFDLVWATDTTGGTRTGLLGTAAYAAPESMLGGYETQPAADIYSLGVTAIFALQGREVTLDFLRNPNRWISQLPVNQYVRSVLSRAVQWDPASRWDSAALFGQELAKAWRAKEDILETESDGGWTGTRGERYFQGEWLPGLEEFRHLEDPEARSNYAIPTIWRMEGHDTQGGARRKSRSPRVLSSQRDVFMAGGLVFEGERLPNIQEFLRLEPHIALSNYLIPTVWRREREDLLRRYDPEAPEEAGAPARRQDV